MQQVDHLARHAEPGDEDPRPAVDDRLDARLDLAGQRGQQVDAERLGRQLPHAGHLLGQLVGAHRRGPERADAAGLADRGDQPVVADTPPIPASMIGCSMSSRSVSRVRMRSTVGTTGRSIAADPGQRPAPGADGRRGASTAEDVMARPGTWGRAQLVVATLGVAVVGSGRVAWNRTSDALRVEIRRRVGAGEGPQRVAAAVGVTVRTVFRVIAEAGGMPCRRVVSPCRLSLADREEISRCVQAGETFTVIAGRVGRQVSTVSREVAAGGGRGEYRAWRADRQAGLRRCRPKAEKLAVVAGLAAAVEVGLRQGWSPEQISGRLPMEFPDDNEMRVSPETIYRSLFLQGRGALRKELVELLAVGTDPTPPAAPGSTGRVGSPTW